MQGAEDFAMWTRNPHCIGSGSFVAVDLPHQHNEFDQFRIANTIINPIGLAPGDQDFAFLHEREVLGNITLARTGFVHQGLHLQFVQVQGAENFQSRGVGNCLEDFRGTFDLIIHGGKHFLRGSQH